MRKQAAKCVLMKDGSVRRRPEPECEQLLASGQAQHYVSKTVWRAASLGITVKDPKTRDADGKLRSLIRDAREKAAKKRKKREQEKEKRERELADMRVKAAREDGSIFDVRD